MQEEIHREEKKISDVIAARAGTLRNDRAPDHERAAAIDLLMTFMGEPAKPASARAAGKTTYGRRFKYWLGRTQKRSPAEVMDLIHRAGSGSNPRALFEHLLKLASAPKA